MLNVLDEFTHESLAIRVARKLKAIDVIESWRHRYNAIRPHESLAYRPPAPEVFVPALAAWPSARLGSAPTATLTRASRHGLN